MARRFYFAYCEAAFDAKYIHNYQILWVKTALPAVPAGPAPLAGAGDSSKRIISSNPVTQVCHPAALSGYDNLQSCRVDI